MIEFGDKYYFFDLKRLDEVVCINPKGKETGHNQETKEIINYDSEGKKLNSSVTTITTTTRGKEVDTIKYDMVRNFVDVVLDTMLQLEGEDDELLGANNALSKKPLAFKMAFNTLVKLQILKEEE